MKSLITIVLMSAGTSIAQVAPFDAAAQKLHGTWECQGPGQTHPMKPPIMWFGAADKGVGVDGFGGAIYGAADVLMNRPVPFALRLKRAKA